MLLPLFLNLEGRRVVLVGGGAVAAAKLEQLLAARAAVRVIAPDVVDEIERTGVAIERRPFEPADLDDAWLVVAAATPEVNGQISRAAEARRLFVNAVDDPANASAFLSGVVRRDGVTLAISTSGVAPGLTALLREALDAVLPEDLSAWVAEARRQRATWKAHRVAMARRRPLLLDALNRLYGRSRGDGRPRGEDSGSSDRGAAIGGSSERRPTIGAGSDGLATMASRVGGSGAVQVSLVGAGPGDPALLTRRALARLRAADLVLYDALVDDRVLRLARHAQRFFVGKRAGRHALDQEAIHALMIRAARRGRRVVRLKGGDPFVLGRGGEEALALAAAGVPVEVVPGITSALAAPALAGIPVTHRGVASAFLVLSGHDERAFAATIGRMVPGAATLVVLMGVARSAALGRRLLDSGWPAAMGAALIVGASSPRQQAWRGTLEDLAAGRVDLSGDGPGTIVIGEVAALGGAVVHIAGTQVDRARGASERDVPAKEHKDVSRR